jgi:hypothetical protein
LPPRPLRPPHDFVEADAEQPRHQLELGALLAVALRPRIRGDRLLVLVRQRAVRAYFEAQRRRETFALGIARFAIDDDRDHVIAAAERLEAPDLLVDVLATRRIGRADHHHELRGFQRRQRLVVQEWPAEKSSRSRKIGRSVFGTIPAAVSRPTTSLSMR